MRDNANNIIGIETIYRDVILVNYGSIFQHYALRRVIRGFGNRVFRCEEGATRNERLNVLFPLRLLRLMFLSWIGLREKPSAQFVNKGWLRFKFIVDYWRLIGRLFEKQHRIAKAFVAGGDSVWCRTVRSDFLLDQDKSARRVSYAASSAWDKFSKDPEWCNCIREVAASYAAIGVREHAGAQAIAALAPQAKVAVVLDPVMLLEREDWFDLIGKFRRQFTKPTLLYYAVNIWNEGSLNLKVLEEAALQLQCDLKIVGIQGAENYIPEKYALRPSPRQFLAMVRDADYFVTNSFHGVVFSVELQKRFAFIAQGARRHGDQNCRQRELLERFSLSDRALPATPDVKSLTSILSTEWNLSEVDSKLADERVRCIKWLKEALA